MDEVEPLAGDKSVFHGLDKHAWDNPKEGKEKPLKNAFNSIGITITKK